MLAGGVKHQHIVGPHVPLKAHVLEVVVVDIHVDKSCIAKLIAHRYVAHPYCPGIHVDGVGEGVVGIGILNAQPAVHYVGIAFNGQLLERPVEMHVAKATSPHVLRHLLNKGMKKLKVDVVGSKEERQPCLGPHGEDIAANVGPRRVVLVDTAEHEDTLLLVVPLAEETQSAQLRLVERKVGDLEVGVQHAAAIEVAYVERSRCLACELKHGDIEDVEDMLQLNLLKVQQQ